MLNGQHLRRVMDGAIAVVVVADRAVEHVVAEDTIKCFHWAAAAFADLVVILIPSRLRSRKPGPGGRPLPPCKCHTSETGPS
jgi:hypothetical protein